MAPHTSSSRHNRRYVDNARNRKLGRVGRQIVAGYTANAFGRIYVDNMINRRLGRVGMPYHRMISRDDDFIEKSWNHTTVSATSPPNRERDVGVLLSIFGGDGGHTEDDW